METYREHMSGKIKEIKKEIEQIELNVNQIELNKNHSHLNFFIRPKLPLINYKTIEKEEINKMLDQIGKDDLFFNNDNLLTNIRIESLENSSNKYTTKSHDIEKSFLSKKTNKTNSKSVKMQKSNRQKNHNTQNTKKMDKLIQNTINNNHHTLELNCNKIPYNKAGYIKKKSQSKKSYKRNISLNKNKNICYKNIDQFINKPNELRKNSKMSKNSNLMTPISTKTKIVTQKNLKKNDELHSSRSKIIKTNQNDITNNNDSSMNISISPCHRGHSVPNIPKNKNYIRLPNKSIIKKNEKLIVELQKIFGEKIYLTDYIYQRMSDIDKKNCINFLLEIIKEMYNVNKINKAKNDGYKQIIEEKYEQIKKIKNEIKEIKKENIKLNKIIKNDNQLIKKLNQNLESLKLQLEKEKIKNKNYQRDKSATKNNNCLYSNKYINDNNSLNKNKIYRENKSQDKMNRNKFINKKSKENSKNRKQKEKINNLEFNKLNKYNNIYEKINANIAWKNIEENRTDISPNSRISNYSKDQNDYNYHILNV